MAKKIKRVDIKGFKIAAYNNSSINMDGIYVNKVERVKKKYKIVYKHINKLSNNAI